MNRKLCTHEIPTAVEARIAVTNISIYLSSVNREDYDASLWNYWRNLDNMVKEFSLLENESRRKQHTYDLDKYRPKLLEAIKYLEEIVFFLKLKQ